MLLILPDLQLQLLPCTVSWTDYPLDLLLWFLDRLDFRCICSAWWRLSSWQPDSRLDMHSYSMTADWTCIVTAGSSGHAGNHSQKSAMLPHPHNAGAVDMKLGAFQNGCVGAQVLPLTWSKPPSLHGIW